MVRITEILPHGNADKLEIAKFEMAGSGPAAYEVVVQRGAHEPGDLAGYFSVDCVVPLDREPFKFLALRPDGQGKTRYRIRAARLRGRFSQGLLTPPLGQPFGADLAGRLGVTYHVRPEPSQPSQPGVRRTRVQPAPVYSVESFRKVPNAFDDGVPHLVTEKVHGTNFRFGWVPRRILGFRVGHRFFVGSHHVEKGGGGPDWYGSDLYAEYARRHDLAERTRAHPGLVFYGELYGYTFDGMAIQDLTYGRGPQDGPGLLMFDVLRLSGQEWLTPVERIHLVHSLGLEHVPGVVPAGIDGLSPHEGMAKLAEGKSLVKGAGNQIREGVVVESIGVTPRRKVKYVSEAYYLRKDA